MLAATAAGNPVAWSAHLIGTHPGAATAASGTVQLLPALGIAWRPTVRAALAASIAWALAVWWLGEGLGGAGHFVNTDNSGNPVAFAIRDQSSPRTGIPLAQELGKSRVSSH